jgi:hypothetical protein
MSPADLVRWCNPTTELEIALLKALKVKQEIDIQFINKSLESIKMPEWWWDETDDSLNCGIERIATFADSLVADEIAEWVADTLNVRSTVLRDYK